MLLELFNFYIFFPQREEKKKKQKQKNLEVPTRMRLYQEQRVIFQIMVQKTIYAYLRIFIGPHGRTYTERFLIGEKSR